MDFIDISTPYFLYTWSDCIPCSTVYVMISQGISTKSTNRFNSGKDVVWLSDCMCEGELFGFRVWWRRSYYLEDFCFSLSVCVDFSPSVGWPCTWYTPLQWRHNERNSVSNNWRLDGLLNRFFRRRSKKTSKLRVTGQCEGNSPVTGEFPSQRASNAENVSIWLRHHAYYDVSAYFATEYKIHVQF